MKCAIRFWLGFLVISLFGCYHPSDYTGDGELTDNGSSAANDRYVLNLGAIDLTRQGSKMFRMKNLPSENFVVGLEIAAFSEQDTNGKKPTTSILIELTEANKNILFTRKGSLDEWTWSQQVGKRYAFVYGRESPKTYFNATPNSEYTLQVTVLKPDPDPLKSVASVKVKSGGWK